jgi:2-polyprenyl-6-methoxyphenol hydroxylase-like FAD-dependent oxidoreductase
MDAEVVIVGGGIGGATLATLLARAGRDVLVLERETTFKDRIRGENILPWGVATARRLGVLDDLLAAGGRLVPFFNMYTMGVQTERRPLPQTTPGGDGCLNMYHPDLQEALLAGARKAGARVQRGAAVQGLIERDDRWAVRFSGNGPEQTVDARLVVGADGRFSKMRQWGGFSVQRDPENLRIAGTMVQGTVVPDDGAYLCVGPGVAAFIAPLGDERARMYFVYPGATGDRKLSGREKTAAFLEACRSTGAPGAWFDGVDVIGPLAEFEGNDQWVTAAAKPGLALIGDAAGATDPSWGSGLSKTLLDVESLATCLGQTADLDAGLGRYAAAHADHYGKLHDILGWMTQLVWSAGPEADARRARVFPRMGQDPTGFPDAVGQGPFGPCDAQARRLILGEA